MSVQNHVVEDIDLNTSVRLLQAFIEEHHRSLVVTRALGQKVVPNPDQQEPEGGIFVTVQVEAGGDFRKSRPTPRVLRMSLRVEGLDVNRQLVDIDDICEELEENGSQFGR